MQGLSKAEAARIAIRAQGLDRRRAESVPAMLERLGAVQLDTISVLARSHELIAYARLGAVGRARVESAYWGHGRTFEYWSHAACILPTSLYPAFAFRRRRFMAQREKWGVDARTVTKVRKALAAHGPQTATDLGGARRESGWWRWSDVKEAVEWMLATGEVVVTDRDRWRRVYDLAERALPHVAEEHWVDDRGVHGPSDAACIRELLLRSVKVLGVGTLDDVKDVHRLAPKGALVRNMPTYRLTEQLSQLVDEGLIREVEVDGETWLADPAALRRVPTGDTSVTTLLSPFDSLVWHRPRLERLFGVHMRIEAYTPSHRRERGYFAMPVLHEGRIIGFVDPAREGGEFVARMVTMLERNVDGFAQAIADAATWVGMTKVRVDAAPSATVARDIQRRANRQLSLMTG